MPKVTIEVNRADEGDMHDLLNIQNRVFPGRRIVRHYHGCVAKLEVEGADARDLIAAMQIGSDDPAFESTAASVSRSEHQTELQLENSADLARGMC